VTPGIVLLNTEFEFNDGRRGEKFNVLLNDGICG